MSSQLLCALPNLQATAACFHLCGRIPCFPFSVYKRMQIPQFWIVVRAIYISLSLDFNLMNNTSGQPCLYTTPQISTLVNSHISVIIVGRERKTLAQKAFGWLNTRTYTSPPWWNPFPLQRHGFDGRKYRTPGASSQGVGRGCRRRVLAESIK